MQRYFIEDKLIEANEIIMNKEDSHHIKNVMRLNVNDQIIINTYKGRVFLSEIIEITKKSVVISILEELKSEFQPINVELILALTKKDQFELAIQKTTELGVKSIGFLPTERSVVKIVDFEKKFFRFSQIIKEASEQSERNTLPVLKSYQNLSEINTEQYDHLLVAYARESSKFLKSLIKEIKPDDNTLILIGPEGGFSKNEIKFLVDKGFSTISLGKSILRAETAAIYVASVFRLMQEE